jgi:hypothetical protein
LFASIPISSCQICWSASRTCASTRFTRDREYFFADSTTRVEGFICQVRRGKAMVFFRFFIATARQCAPFEAAGKASLVKPVMLQNCEFGLMQFPLGFVADCVSLQPC